jgi:hypothetical protein
MSEHSAYTQPQQESNGHGRKSQREPASPLRIILKNILNRNSFYFVLDGWRSQVRDFPQNHSNDNLYKLTTISENHGKRKPKIKNIQKSPREDYKRLEAGIQEKKTRPRNLRHNGRNPKGSAKRKLD